MRIFENGNLEQYEINSKWYRDVYLPYMKVVIAEKDLKNIYDVNFLEIV